MPAKKQPIIGLGQRAKIQKDAADAFGGIQYMIAQMSFADWISLPRIAAQRSQLEKLKAFIAELEIAITAAEEAANSVGEKL